MAESKTRIKNRYYNYRKRCRDREIEPLAFDAWHESQLAVGFDPQGTQRKPRERLPLWYARVRYSRHQAQARYRNIPWEFGFDSWYAWWASHGIDRNIPNPERGRDRLCMCRVGDEGPYSPGNVYLATHSENTRDSFQNVARPGFSDGWPKGKKRK